MSSSFISVGFPVSTAFLMKKGIRERERNYEVNKTAATVLIIIPA